MPEPIPADAPPLAGLRVLELANYMAGPFCGMLLADLGAEVIKIENPQGGDFTRRTGPFLNGESAGFIHLNRNKKSVTLNLKHPRGRALFLDLVRTADALIENFRPGTMRDLDLDYDTLLATNPRLIINSASGYGQNGPYAHRAALDLIIQGMSGLMSITGEPGGRPVKAGVPIADLTTGLYGALAILAAYVARERTGQGQHVDLSLFESAISLEVWETSGYFATGEIPKPLGSAHRVTAPYRAYRTRDGYVTIGATSPNLWPVFCRTLGLESLEHDPRFATATDRRANEEELCALIEQVTTRETSEHWYRLLEQAGIPCGFLLNVAQVVDDEHVRARGFVHELEHPRAGRVRMTGIPPRFSRTPARINWPGPVLGQHTAEVLAELGCDEDDLASLRAECVI